MTKWKLEKTLLSISTLFWLTASHVPVRLKITSQKLALAQIWNKRPILKVKVVGAYSRGRLFNIFLNGVGVYSRWMLIQGFMALSNLILTCEIQWVLSFWSLTWELYGIMWVLRNSNSLNLRKSNFSETPMLFLKPSYLLLLASQSR